MRRMTRTVPTLMGPHNCGWIDRRTADMLAASSRQRTSVRRRLAQLEPHEPAHAHGHGAAGATRRREAVAANTSQSDVVEAIADVLQRSGRHDVAAIVHDDLERHAR